MTREHRTYNQFCPIARTLDVLGERWTLLIVRELMSGPKRFKDLQDSLVGIGTNLLSARLKEMERHAIVQRSRLPSPWLTPVYVLTERGRALDDLLRSMIRWGLPLMVTPRADGEHFRPHWLLHGMLVAFDASRADGVNETYQFEIDAEVFHLSVRNGKASGDMGPGHAPDLVWASDSATFMNFALGRISAEAALSARFVKVGDPATLRRMLELFDPLPLDAAAPLAAD